MTDTATTRRENDMSRNKDIELIHQITGWSYKESRRRYHENGHDLLRTLPFNSEVMNSLFDATKSVILAVSKAAEDLGIALKDAFSKIDVNELAKAAKELRERQLQEDTDENLSDNSIQE